MISGVSAIFASFFFLFCFAHSIDIVCRWMEINKKKKRSEIEKKKFKRHLAFEKMNVFDANFPTKLMLI